MISRKCDIAEFVRNVTSADARDVVLVVEQECIEAERLRLRRPDADEGGLERPLGAYVDQLKGLIGFLRYGVKPIRLDAAVFQEFHPLCERLDREDTLRPGLLSHFDRSGL